MCVVNIHWDLCVKQRWSELGTSNNLRQQKKLIGTMSCLYVCSIYRVELSCKHACIPNNRPTHNNHPANFSSSSLLLFEAPFLHKNNIIVVGQEVFCVFSWEGLYLLGYDL